MFGPVWVSYSSYSYLGPWTINPISLEKSQSMARFHDDKSALAFVSSCKIWIGSGSGRVPYISVPGIPNCPGVNPVPATGSQSAAEFVQSPGILAHVSGCL